MLTLEQAIDDLMDASRSITEVAESESDEANRINAQNVADDCEQLAELLRELQERRKAPEIVRCGECEYASTDATCCLVCNRDGIGLKPYHVRGDDYCSYAKRRANGENLSE